MQRCLFFAVVFIALAITTPSCVYHELPKTVCAPGISYTNDVKPIVEQKCILPTCHNGDNGADLKWSEFPKFQSHALSGEIKRVLTDHIMPPPGNPGLTDLQIQTITCWADQGALQN
jgi:hypothetical protein